MRLDRSFLRESALALGARVVGALASFALTMAVARRLAPSDVGLYLLANVVLTVCSVAGRLGLDDSLTRFIGGRGGLGDWGAVRGVSRVGAMLVLAASTVIALALAAGADALADAVFHKPALAPALRLAAVALVPLSLATAFSEMLKGARRLFTSQILLTATPPALTLALLLAARVATPAGVIACQAVGYLLALVAALALWRSVVRAHPAAIHVVTRDELMASCLPSYGVALLNLVLAWTATLMLAAWGTSDDIALFGLAARTAFLVNFLLIAVSNAASPQFAALHHRGEREALGALARRSTRLALLLASPFLLVCLVLPGWVMRLYGAHYASAGPLLVILTLGQVVNLTTGAVGYLLMMTGQERLQRNNHVLTAVVMLLLGLALIPRYGAMGAALATMGATITLNATGAMLAYRHLGINVLPLPIGTARGRGAR